MSFSISEKELDCFGIGSRKSAVAKVSLVLGTGKLIVNLTQGEKYLQFNSEYINSVKLPLAKLGVEHMYDIYVKTHGGGVKAQAEAIKLGVARALCYLSPENRASLKSEGFLSRDARCKERKKYGLKKARKASQFSKR